MQSPMRTKISEIACCLLPAAVLPMRVCKNKRLNGFAAYDSGFLEIGICFCGELSQMRQFAARATLIFFFDFMPLAFLPDWIR